MEETEPRRPETSEATAAAGLLDDSGLVERLDPHGLLGRIEALPEQCEEAWQRAKAIELPPGYTDAREVVVLGMGGSGIAGAILASLASITGRKPVSVVRGYEAPPFVGGESFVVACSHSGNTEETLSAFEQAAAAGAKMAVVSTGGRLAGLGEALGAPLFVYTYEGEPRSALGHQLMTLLALGERASALPPAELDVQEAVSLMTAQRERIGFAAPAERNAAKQIAGRLRGKLPVAIGAGALAVAAQRWKTQLNENSKSWAIVEELPELDHNSIEGFGGPRAVAERMHALFLSNAGLHPRVLRRYEATADALSQAGVSNERVEIEGTSALAQALSAIYLGDLVSYYLALLNGVEPSPVRALQRLKERLAGN